MALGPVIDGGAGGGTVCGIAGTGFCRTVASCSSSSRSRQLRRLEIHTEAHENERQCLADSMCTRCLPRLNEIERPAWADEPQADQLSAISTARKQRRFI